MKRNIFRMTMLFTVLLLTACAESPAQADVLSGPVSTEAVQMILTDGPEEPVQSEIRFTEIPEGTEIPEFYVPVFISGVTEEVYAFTDTAGYTQLRVYGELSPTDENSEVVCGFVPISVVQNGEEEAEGVYAVAAQLEMSDNALPVYGVQYKPGTLPVDAEAEQPGICSFGEAGEGFVLPDGYSVVDGYAGLFTYSDAENKVFYRAYGEFEDGKAGFYPADATGTVASGALMVDVDMEKAFAEFCRETEGIVVPASFVLLNVDGELVRASLVVPEMAEAEEAASAAESSGQGNASNDKKSDNNGNASTASKPSATVKPESKPSSTPAPSNKPSATPKPGNANTGNSGNTGSAGNAGSQDDDEYEHQNLPEPGKTEKEEPYIVEVIAEPEYYLDYKEKCTTCGAIGTEPGWGNEHLYESMSCQSWCDATEVIYTGRTTMIYIYSDGSRKTEIVQ